MRVPVVSAPAAGICVLFTGKEGDVCTGWAAICLGVAFRWQARDMLANIAV
jgi:hypothetical protein